MFHKIIGFFYFLNIVYGNDNDYNNEERVTMEKSIDFFQSDNWIQERAITLNDYITATVSTIVCKQINVFVSVY